DAVGIESTPCGDRVWERVFVDPDHRIAAVDGEPFRLVLHALDYDGVGRRSGGGADCGAAAEHERQRAGQRSMRWPPLAARPAMPQASPGSSWHGRGALRMPAAP